MKTKELIEVLARQTKPVRRLPSPARRLATWIFLSSIWITAWISFFGVPAEVTSKMKEFSFWLESAPVLLIALLSAYIALALGIPGEARLPHVKKVMVFFAASWLLAFIAGIPSRSHEFERSIAAGPGALCVESILELGFGPAILLLWMIRRGVPLYPGWNGVVALLGAASLAAFGTQWLCPYDFPLHFLVWHLAPAWLLGAAGYWLGKKVLWWLPRNPSRTTSENA
ncbi:MAG: NrsF family protein [Bdellovibrionales bacterium]